ncbi:ankyrin repeat, SAM and basic leucine zipper domain-containing protein 1-like [Ptychodera flava]|uniref:ankyrin repeat, SAM and basic leucine zipper domain-containing protein 1-like n=1 Tax=Ptychodera flava TaxID=63121 RepID=UPI00396A5D20
MATDVSLGYRPAGDEDGYGDFEDEELFLHCGTFDKEPSKGTFTIGHPETDSPPHTNNTNIRVSPPDLRKRSNSFGRRKRSPRRERQGSPLVVEDVRSAVIRGNVTEVQSYIDKGFPVDSILKTGWTALMYAASFSNCDIVKFLLDRGADPNFHKDRFTVLMCACSCNKENEDAVLSCVNELIHHGANVNSHDRYHMTALMYAARQGYPSVVKKLLHHQTDINKQDVRGWTALIWASSKGHLHVAKTLLELDADPNKCACDGQKPSDIAYAQGHTTLAELLEFAANPNQGNCRITHNSMSNGTQDEECANQSPSQSNSLVNASQTYVRYGDLELFLCGLELGQLVPLFQEQQISFSAFLRMNDSDLEKIGIRQLGYRKRILEAIHHVHKKEWEPSSLTSQNLHSHKVLSPGETSAIIANITKHCDYMASTVGYISEQAKTAMAETSHCQGQGGTSMDTLSADITEAMKKVRLLHSDLVHLRLQVMELSLSCDGKPVDLIEDPDDARSLSASQRILPWVGVGGFLLLGAFWIKTCILK